MKMTTMTLRKMDRRPPRSLLRLAFLAGLLAGWAGCADRTHLTKTHGRAYNEAFGRQAVEPEPRKRGHEDPTQGLDSQEAAAIAGSYRRSLAGKEGGGDPNGQHQMVLVGPGGAASAGGYMPPPSVPGGQ